MVLRRGVMPIDPRNRPIPPPMSARGLRIRENTQPFTTRLFPERTLFSLIRHVDIQFPLRYISLIRKYPYAFPVETVRA